jgi:hypothetical protein
MSQLPPHRPEVLASFVDSYELTLHAELGALLRAASVLDGDIVQVTELVDSQFSGPLDDELWTA